MAYGQKDNEIKNSNVNYLARDFNDMKSSLIQYAKSYFPNTYKDFNETSPGMMLLEMSAYVGDVLNFYIDSQYKEMLLPLAEDRKSLITLAKGQGYKVKPNSPSYATMLFQQTIDADSTTGKPLYNQLSVIDKGCKISQGTNIDLVFETLDVVDFTVSSSSDMKAEVASVTPATGVPATYKFKRKVRAVSGVTTTKNIIIDEPQKFKRITLDEPNIIEILKVEDSNKNKWYEVENLAQDKVQFERHYTSDQDRNTGYITQDGKTIPLPVPYSLEYIKTGKRFVTEVDENNQTHIIFGNGVLKNGNTFDAGFLAVEQVGINLPGAENNREESIDPLLGDAYGTLGEAPAHTTLTITYRVGGGSSANSSVDTINNIQTIASLNSGGTDGIVATNSEPAVGGTAGESTEEIRQRSIANVSTQQRCVTKQDFESRVMNMPAKFGNIAKVYCTRSGAIRTAQREQVKNVVTRLKDVVDLNFDLFKPKLTNQELGEIRTSLKDKLDADRSGGLNPDDFNKLLETLELTFSNVTDNDRIYTIDLYTLSYDNGKNLIDTPTIIQQNLKNYLDEYRMLTDQISFHNGYVINFGIIFDVVALSHENKEQVKLRCVDEIKKYFSIDKMQFKQIIYTSDVETLLMDVDGVRAVNYVTVTQDRDYNAVNESETNAFTPALYTKAISSAGNVENSGTTGYGYYYDFSEFYGNKSVAGKGILLPAYEPAVFELKNPNKNIKGIVR